MRQFSAVVHHLEITYLISSTVIPPDTRRLGSKLGHALASIMYNISSIMYSSTVHYTLDNCRKLKYYLYPLTLELVFFYYKVCIFFLSNTLHFLLS